MRLIDADAITEFDFSGIVNIFPDDYAGMAKLLKRRVDRAPTIDPTVHAKWIAVPSSDLSTGKAYECSECLTMRFGSYMPPYCQHCGAKMDGGDA